MTVPEVPQPSEEARRAVADAAASRSRVAAFASWWRSLSDRAAEMNAANHYAQTVDRVVRAAAQTPRPPGDQSEQ